MPRRAPPLHWMVLAAILCSLAIISVANAQQPLCSTRADITMQLSEQYAEVPVSLGVANNGGVMEVLSAPNGKTWTLILTMPDGMSCMIAAGDDWRRRVMPTGGIDG
jgi:hypothetical protein